MLRPRRVGGRWVLTRGGFVGTAAYSDAKRGAQPDRHRHSDHDGAPADPIGQIEELSELHERGILTDEEFSAEKKRLLGI